jgi:hypothetical protein
MRVSKRQRGFLTFAQNGRHDYLRMAYGLALSLQATQAEPYLTVVVTPGTAVPERYRSVFDEVIEVPWLDEAKDAEWKLQNEWKAYHVTPYVETIKLDADMLFTNDIAAWWPLFNQDVLGCTTVETYRGEVATSDFYRQCFTANRLPNLYSSFLYFRLSDFAQEYFALCESIFHDWQAFFGEFLEPLSRPLYISTDVVYALAAQLMGDCVYPALPVPRFVHMKTRMQNWQMIDDEDWSSHVPVSLTDDLSCRRIDDTTAATPPTSGGRASQLILKLGRYRQSLPVHYHLKNFLTDAMIETYERYLAS